jgi:hypothetical protein
LWRLSFEVVSTLRTRFHVWKTSGANKVSSLALENVERIAHEDEADGTLVLVLQQEDVGQVFVVVLLKNVGQCLLTFSEFFSNLGTR